MSTTRDTPGPLRALFVVLALGIALTPEAFASGRNASYFFPVDEVLRVRVSPGGDWVVASATNGKTTGLLAQRIDGLGVEVVSQFRNGICDLMWIDDDTLLVCTGPRNRRRWSFVTMIPEPNGDFRHGIESVVVPGFPVSTLPYVEGELLWGISTNKRSSIHRVTREDLFRYRDSIRKTNETRADLAGQIAELDGWIEGWVVTPDGVPVAARRWEEGDSRTVFHRPVGEEVFSIIGSYGVGERDLVSPFGVASDGEHLIISAYNARDTIGIYEFDPATRTIGDEIFHRDDVSVEWIYFDPLTDDVQAFTYTSGTETLIHYLDRPRAQYASALGAGAPSLERVKIVSSTSDRRTFVYHEEGPSEPGSHFLRLVDQDETIAIGQKGAKIQRDSLSLAETFVSTSKDGTVVESILTLASAHQERPTPLIVMPHGGPIGVGDRLKFNPVVQYFASWGFAVLQVNYRGSSGYGSEFMEAGRRQWARGIEDDIDAATLVALERDDIDQNRVCIMGGSYGGFSALASVRRHPDRFRCAVSINGVTDVPMIAETSDTADSDAGLAWFAWMVGDPEEDREELVSISPAYGLANVDTPIMMVYGDSDRRVDPDHSERVVALLELYGVEHEELRIEDVGHDFDRRIWIPVLPEILGFLERHTAEISDRRAQPPTAPR